MYYFYFVYVAILGGLMYYECATRNHPKWWVTTVVLAPITAPYFLLKSRKESGIILLMVFMATFTGVTLAEIILYKNYVKDHKYDDLPPVTSQMIRLSEELKKSTFRLDSALIKLENLSKVESRINEIRKTIEFIGVLREIMYENQNAIERLVKHTVNHQQYFEKKDLQWVFDIQDFYHNRNVIRHYQSLEKYLDEFEDLLRYTYENFYFITDHKDTEHLKNYDEYYIRYRRAVDSHNRFNVKRIEFQNEYLKKHPKIKPYLPGERQTETFRLWD